MKWSEFFIVKSTGVTRRIDELGRIVIPKEIRRSLSIRDGENIEILVEEDKIILKKFLLMDNIGDLSQKLTDIFSSIDNDMIIITDRVKVVATTDIYKHLVEQSFDTLLIKYIDNREIVNIKDGKLSFSNNDIYGNFVIVPIISNTDSLGLVIITKNDSITNDTDLKSAKIIAKILAEKINIS